MDEAARRVNMAALARLADLRGRREEAAARELRRLASTRTDADAAREQAGEDVVAREGERRSGERAIYDDLAEAGPVGLSGLESRRLAVARLGDTVAAARTEEKEKIRAAAAARAAHERGRSAHAQRMRELRKWDRVLDRAQTSLRIAEEVASESEAEDDVSDRFAGRTGAATPS